MSPIQLGLFALYALAGLGYGALFVGRAPALGRAARPLLVLALVLHLASLVARAVRLHTLPITTLPDMLSTVSCSLAAVYLYLEVRQGTPMTGVFVVPVVMVLAFAAGLPFPPLKSERELLKLLELRFFPLHMLCAFTGYCAAALAAVYGGLYLMLYHELKLGRLTLIYHRLPPLEELKQLNVRSTQAAFVLLSGAIAIAMLVLVRKKPEYLLDAKVLATFVVWVIFGLSIVAHARWTRSTRAPVLLSLAGFALLLLTTLVIGPLASSFHIFLFR